MKTITIKRSEYHKVEKELPFNLPTEPIYLFIFGLRLSVRVVPVFSSVSEEEKEVYELHVTIVPQWPNMKIEAMNIRIYDIAQFLKAGRDDLKIILETIDNHEIRNIRTKEQFDEDFNRALKDIQQYE